MDAISKKWEVIEALRSSTKGKLRYEREWSPEFLTEVVPQLSPLATRTLDLIQQRSPTSLDEHDGQSCVSTPSPSASPSSPVSINNKSLINENRSNSSRLSHHNDNFNPMVSLTENAAEIEAQIRQQEELHNSRAKALLLQRCMHLEAVQRALHQQATQQFKRYEESLELEQRLTQERRKDELEKSLEEAQKKLERIKEEHHDRAKVLNIRLLEAAEQRRREEEEERRRLVEARERARRLNALQEEILALNRRAQPSPPQPGVTATSTAAAVAGTQSAARAQLAELRTRAGQLCDAVAAAARHSSDGSDSGPSPQDLGNAEQVLVEMRLLALQAEALRLEEERRAEAEREDAQRRARDLQQRQQQERQQQESERAEQQKQQQKKQEESSMKDQAGVGLIDVGIVRWYKELQSNLDETTGNMDGLSSSKDSQIKAIKFDLAKAVSTPLSQIGCTSGSHLREITGKLNSLLSGQTITSSNCSVNVSRHPQGLHYVQFRLGEKLVTQGEEEVSSHHEAAFPIAAVAVSLWDRHPPLGKLFLAHLHRRCPYTVPIFLQPKPGQSQEDFFRTLGYRYNENTLEKQDLFLNRMSGMMRLYAAIIATPVSSVGTSNHPHGLQYGWRWIAQILNLQPVSDITATMLFDFLEVAGNAMQRAYCNQFWKLLHFIVDDYLPRIEKVSSPAQMGSVGRLKLFIEECFTRRTVPLPGGYLSDSFWRT